MIRTWDILGRQTAYACPVFEIQKKQARSPRTGRIHEVQSIHIPAWIMVMAITADQQVVMVRQYRHGIEDVCLELPGGLVDPSDASPLVAARRELLEETGYAVETLEQIGCCYPQPAVLANQGLFFLGQGATPVQAQTLDVAEDVEIVTVPLADIAGMVAQAKITHGMVLLAFFYYAVGPGKGRIQWL